MEFNLPWDELQSTIRDSVELVKDENAGSIKIVFKGELPEGMPIQEMVKGEQQIKQMMGMFMDEKIEFETEMMEEGKGVLLKFTNNEDLTKVYDFIDNLFFGDGLKNLIEKIMQLMVQAFGSEDESEE